MIVPNTIWEGVVKALQTGLAYTQNNWDAPSRDRTLFELQKAFAAALSIEASEDLEAP